MILNPVVEVFVKAVPQQNFSILPTPLKPPPKASACPRNQNLARPLGPGLSAPVQTHTCHSLLLKPGALFPRTAHQAQSHPASSPGRSWASRGSRLRPRSCHRLLPGGWDHSSSRYHLHPHPTPGHVHWSLEHPSHAHPHCTGTLQ